jgi:hypothetical protein
MYGKVVTATYRRAQHDLDTVVTRHRTMFREKPGHDIRYLCAEFTGSYPVGTSSKSHNCCTGTGQRA